MKYAAALIPALIVLAFSCGRQAGWQAVGYDEGSGDGSFATEVVTDHQGEHVLDKCRIYLDSDTLYIDFPAGLPAYWGGMTARVHEGRFEARFHGIPFDGGEASFVTLKERLALQKAEYVPGDTLAGQCDFLFRQTDGKTGRHDDFYFRGKIGGIVRDRDFDPFDSRNFMGFDLSTALYELGEPLYREIFDARSLPGFRVELPGHLPESGDMIVEELTWDASPMRDLSDEGRQRLTIRYAERDGVWQPVHYKEWMEDVEP